MNLHGSRPAIPYRLKQFMSLKDLGSRICASDSLASRSEFSNYELIVRYSDDSYLFVYNYGSVVFFNVPDELQERELGAIQEYRLPADQGRATDIFLVEVDPVAHRQSLILIAWSCRSSCPRVYENHVACFSLRAPRSNITRF